MSVQKIMQPLSNFLTVEDLTNKQVRIMIKPNERLEIIDDMAQHQADNLSIEFIIQENGFVNYLFKDVERNQKRSENQKNIIRDITVTLTGKGADANIRGLCFGSSTDTFVFKTLQSHYSAGATSNVEIKSILTDKARLRCNSLIKLEKEAQQTNAQQLNKNILLSRDARAVSIPMLEVEANDVKCSHGAAISQFNDDHLFYLQSRGLDVDQTKDMLIEAFLS